MMRARTVSERTQSWIRRSLAMLLPLAVGTALFASPAAAQRDARVMQRNLAQLVGDSYTIVVGRVVSVKAEPHPQYNSINTIVVTLQVSEVWKGQAGPQFTFRAFVNHPSDFKERLGYGDGQDVLLMLTQPSQIGMSSPAGLEQGRFRVFTDASGSRMIVNSLGNGGLFYNFQKSAPKLVEQMAGLPAVQLLTQHRSGPIPFDQFKSIVQTLIATPQQ